MSLAQQKWLKTKRMVGAGAGASCASVGREVTLKDHREAGIHGAWARGGAGENAGKFATFQKQRRLVGPDPKGVWKR